MAEFRVGPRRHGQERGAQLRVEAQAHQLTQVTAVPGQQLIDRPGSVGPALVEQALGFGGVGRVRSHAILPGY
jgi:hypothetical protein